jgi:hypothetical protein
MEIGKQMTVNKMKKTMPLINDTRAPSIHPASLNDAAVARHTPARAIHPDMGQVA